MKSLSLCIGWVVRETTREHVNPFCTDSVGSVLKASLLSWTSDLAGACIKALQYQVLHTNWFGSSLQTSSCHLSLCCWNGSLNPAVRMLKSIERLMQMPSPILPFVVQAKIQKKKKKGGEEGCLGIQGTNQARLKRHETPLILWSHLPPKPLCGAHGFHPVVLAQLKGNNAWRLLSFPANESLHYTRWHCLILTFCSVGSLHLEHPVAAASLGIHQCSVVAGNGVTCREGFRAVMEQESSNGH